MIAFAFAFLAWMAADDKDGIRFSPRQFVMRGYELGKSTLTLWCEDGRPRSFSVVVSSPADLLSSP